MRARRPFVAALVLVVGGVGVSAAQPRVADWWADRHAEQQAGAELARLRPAVTALNRMAPLPGLTDCAGMHDVVRSDGAVCLVGEADVVATTVALARKLTDVGATVTERRCVRLPTLGVLCRVTATIEGRDAAFSVGPQVSQSGATVPHGVMISGALGTWAFAPLPRHAPEVALPS